MSDMPVAADEYISLLFEEFGVLLQLLASEVESEVEQTLLQTLLNPFANGFR